MFGSARIIGEVAAIALGFGLAYLVSRVVHLKPTAIPLAVLLVLAVLSQWVLVSGFMGFFAVKVPMNHVLVAFLVGWGGIVVLQRRTKSAAA